TDLNFIAYYNLNTAGSVIVVSLVEQALRFYQNGRLVKAFQVTTGQYARPTPPGLWNIFLREHPTEFKSSEPKGSAFWYPPTKIDYAMEYHDGGYFFHDSWWRADYGVGTNFPTTTAAVMKRLPAMAATAASICSLMMQTGCTTTQDTGQT